MTAATSVRVWERLLANPDPAWQAEIARICREADARRSRAAYDTGSILELEAYLLRALAEHLRAIVVIEVGTFIGTSTMALASASTVQRVYTCDVSNDCLPKTPIIRTFPKTRSVDMLRTLIARGVRADLCFFDGVLHEEDALLLVQATSPSPVFVVHDFTYGPKERRKGGAVYYETVPRKGIGNVGILQREWAGYQVVEPWPGTTLAALVPESMR